MSHELTQHFCSFICCIGDDDGMSDAITRLPSVNQKATRYDIGLVKLIVSLPDSNALFKHYVRCYGDLVLFIQGDFYQPAELSLSGKYFSGGVLDGYKVARFVSTLNGVFCGFIANSKSGEVLAFTDLFGFGMMYTCNIDNKVVLSSSIWPLITNKNWRGPVNDLAAEQILLFGFPLGDSTIYENIKVIRPATVRRIDSSASEFCYRNIDRASDTTDIKDVTAAMNDAINNHFGDVRECLSVSRYGLALSGGHDSRVVLNGMLNSKLTPECFVGFRGSLSRDAKNAIWTAKLGRCKYTVFDYSKQSAQESIDNNILLDGAETGNWSMALAREAAINSRDVLYFGTSGDFISGGWRFDPATFSNRQELASAALNADYEYGVKLDQFCSILRDDNGERVIDSYFQSYDKPLDDLRDVFMSQRLDEKNFHRIRTFMRGAYLYSSPAHLFHDKRIATEYLNMPYSMLRKQKAHIKMCSTGNLLQGIIPATNYPVPVVLEPHLIPVIKKLLPGSFVSRYKNRSVKKKASEIPDAWAYALDILKEYEGQVPINIGKLEDIIRFDSKAQLISLRARYLANMLEPDLICAQSRILGSIEIVTETVTSDFND